MKGLTLKHLRYFDALARHGHFGRAADRCGITQPALSQQIKELETMLGRALVERTTRHVRLTALGEDFWNRTSKILLSVDDLDDLVRAGEGPLSGRLRLGIIPTAAPYLLPQIIQSLNNRFPAVELEPRETITKTLVEDLMASRLDVAVVALPISEPALREFALFDEDFVLVRPVGDAHLPVPGPARLQNMRLLLLEEGHCFRDQALTFCKLDAIRPRALMEGSSLSTLVQMVGAGMGLTLIPDMAVDLETRAANVSVSRFPAPAPKRTMGMVWRKTNPLSQQLMDVGAAVRAAAQIKPKRDP